ncbi:MAG: hypothetical protein EOO99_05855 [Pedobacter sp.]|nr:MAG: hypothetical protein EOO99_05855 [Pedobacter sp.]
MKLSNKVLLITGIALIIIPMVSMFAISRIYFEKGEYKTEDFVAHKAKGFKETESNYTAIKTAPFQEVNLEGLSSKETGVSFIVGPEFGVKISEAYKEDFQIENLSNGQLKIQLKDDSNVGVSQVKIKIFAPKLSQISIDGSSTLWINYFADSLKLNVNNIGRLYIDDQEQLHNLTLVANNLESLHLNKEVWNSLKIETSTDEQKESKLFFYQNQIEYLDLKANGKQELFFGSRDKGAEILKIKDLNLQTTGAVQLIMPAVEVEKAKGSISDETYLSIPAKIIKLLYNF